GSHRLRSGHDGATRRGGCRLREVVAAVDDVAGRTERARGPLLHEIGLEGLELLLLRGALQLLLDLGLDPRERLGARRVHRLHLDQVPAALALERADELTLRRREDLLVERRLALPLGDALAQPAVGLRRGVGRELLRRLLPG